MKLYLVRHGEAVDPDLEGDPPLSPKGCHEVRQVASLLSEEGVCVDHIFHSFKLRAAQTAGILASMLTDDGTAQEQNGLGPSDGVDSLLDEMAGWTGDRMLVGHLPFLQKFCAALFTDSDSKVPFTIPTGSVICIESRSGDSWSLRWMVKPETLT